MKAFRIVADSSCLIGLAQIKQFELLKELFLEVCIPHAQRVPRFLRSRQS